MLVETFLAQATEAQQPEALLELFKSEAGRLGYDRVAYIGMPTIALGSEMAESPTVIHTYPTAWATRYVEQGYSDIDPVLRAIGVLRSPFLWADLPRLLDCSKPQRQVMLEAQDVGIRDGVSVPIYGPCGEWFLVSFAASQAGEHQPVPSAQLQLMAGHFHFCYRSLAGAMDPARHAIALTAREKDCLLWCARGKSSWEIGAIMGISENTVNFHFKNLLVKLRCNSRIMAVVKAVQQNLIMP